MNTPKLISLLSGSTGVNEPSRFGKAADPIHGLDFSRLLGEKRSQPAPTPARPSQSDVGQSRNNKSNGSNSAHNASAATRQDSQGRNVSTGNASASAQAHAPAANEPARDNTQQLAARDNQHAESAQTNTPAQGATDTATAANPAADSDTAPAAGTVENTELADAAAETGLPALAAAQATPLAAVLAADGGAAQPTATGGAQAQLPGQIPATAQPATAQAAAVPAAQPEADALAAIAQKAGETPLPAGGQASAAKPQTASLQAAIAQVANAAAQTQSGNAHAATAAALQPNTDTQAATALPQAQALEVTHSAAALSLQEFTAMVAAARATSGTELAPLHPQATPFSGGPFAAPLIAGLMPGSVLPGQVPVGVAAGSTIAAPLNSPQWPTEFGRQFISIAQAANGQGQVAELRLDPPELGPLRITINLNDNVAHAVISSPHAMVRQTVENALPQLQQMLEQAGISLGQANVNDQHQPGQESQDAAPGGTMHARAEGSGIDADSVVSTGAGEPGRRADPNALVDTFA